MHQPTTAGHIFSVHYGRNDGARIGVNVVAHQKEQENKNTSKKKAGKEKRQATDFRETEWYPSVIFRGQHGKKMNKCRECRR